jgi:hypothetical protein
MALPPPPAVSVAGTTAATAQVLKAHEMKRLPPKEDMLCRVYWFNDPAATLEACAMMVQSLKKQFPRIDPYIVAAFEDTLKPTATAQYRQFMISIAMDQVPHFKERMRLQCDPIRFAPEFPVLAHARYDVFIAAQPEHSYERVTRTNKKSEEVAMMIPPAYTGPTSYLGDVKRYGSC